MDDNSNAKRIIALIGLIASCIGIFVFMTGWESIDQSFEAFFNSLPPPERARVTATAAISSPTLSSTPTEIELISGNWIQVGLAGDTIPDLVVADVDKLYAATLGYNHGIFGSRDGGTTWTAINNGLGSLEVYDIDVFGTDSDSVVAATESGLWLTRDGGQHWQPLGPSGYQRLTMLGVSSLPTEPSTIVAVGVANYGAFITYDTGRTWNRVEYYGPSGGGDIFWNVSLWRANSASQPSPTICLAGYNRLFRSSDGGKSWIRVADVGASYDIAAIAVSPTNADVVYACTGGLSYSHGVSYYEGNGLYKSTDGGGSWVPINNGLPNQGFETECTAVTVHPGNATNVYVAMNGQVFASHNGGNSWSQLSSLPAYLETIHTLAVNDAKDILCIGTNEGGVWCIPMPE